MQFTHSCTIFVSTSRFLKWKPTEWNTTVVKRCGSQGQNVPEHSPLLFRQSFPDVMMFNHLTLITMETKDNSKIFKTKLLAHHWYLNYNEYENHISFIWKHNEIRIDIRSNCEPPGRDKCIHFNFLINGEHTLFKFYYDCYGGGSRGKTPELLTDNHRLTFSATPYVFEIYEETIKQEDNQIVPTEALDDKKKDVWISVYEGYRSGVRCDTPFKDDKIMLWIKKSYDYQYSSDILMYKYELYSNKLLFLTPTRRNFVRHKIFDHCKSIGCGVYASIGCEISDGKGVYRKYYWAREGLEELAMFEIIRFFQSLRCYIDWNDYDTMQDLYKSSGVTDQEIDK